LHKQIDFQRTYKVSTCLQLAPVTGQLPSILNFASPSEFAAAALTWLSHARFQL